ncbi:MAG TPA: pyridoxal 5'-phosphate synthase glutaminase subunit PdxT [Acidimicrobiia bacterium]|jgi:5'-phosphate synthase pdxT subunit
MKVGILALQGAFREHAEACAALGADVTLVKRPEHLAAVDAVVLPGGESTTQEKLLESSGLREPLVRALGDGMPCLATCAGVILLARTVADGRADQRPLGVLDLDVRRNGYGRQVDSFEADLAVAGLPGGPFHGVFIRAPRIERAGPSVEVLAAREGDPVLVRSGACVGTTFHPELAGDLRIHETFLRGKES